MFRMDKWYLKGWLYFLAMFVLTAVLPPSFGRENGVIENIQLLWLVAGFCYSWRMRHTKQVFWGGNSNLLWSAGAIYFFLLFMREISWGRVFLSSASGGTISYGELGLYGKIVHPLVGVLICVALYLVIRARIWRMLLLVKLPAKSFLLLLLFIIMSWVGEKSSIPFLHSQVLEELAEFGAYMMMYYIARDLGARLAGERQTHAE